MQYRILPADGTKISEIGLGLGIVTPQDDVRALLNGALERQINYFDLCGLTTASILQSKTRWPAGALRSSRRCT